MASKNPTIKFSPEALRRGFGIAKLVKPKTGDFVLKLIGTTLSIVSYDARKYARAEVPSIEATVPDGFVSDEFFLSEDRKSLLETDLALIEISITEKGMNVRAKDADKSQDRKAVIRRRPDNSRRPLVPKRLEASGGFVLKASVLEDLLRHLSCSALIKETKTEDDMRINQVHFYSEHSCAFANARSHATVATLPGLNLDCSIVSSDVPLVKGFCSKLGDSDVELGQDKTHLWVRDPKTGSCVFAARVNGKRPDFSFSGLEEDQFKTRVKVYGDDFNMSVGWAVTAVEGTGRLNFSVKKPPTDPGKGDADMVLTADGEEVSKFPVTIEDGSFNADFHIGSMSQISPYLTHGDAVLRYSHKADAALLDICMVSASTGVQVRHFIRSMKARSL